MRGGFVQPWQIGFTVNQRSDKKSKVTRVGLDFLGLVDAFQFGEWMIIQPHEKPAAEI